MHYTFNSLLFVAFLSLCHCTTTPPKPKPQYLPKSQSSYSEQDRHSSRYNDIDVNALIQELSLDHPVEKVGFTERAFNTCRVKSNRSKQPLCKRLYVGRLNFQVVCRQSTGTVQKVSLTPLYSNKLRWKQHQGKRGLTSTNSSGFGSLGFISPYSSRAGHLYLYLGSKIARKRLSDRWKLVLPKTWCQSQ